MNTTTTTNLQNAVEKAQSLRDELIVDAYEKFHLELTRLGLIEITVQEPDYNDIYLFYVKASEWADRPRHVSMPEFEAFEAQFHTYE